MNTPTDTGLLATVATATSVHEPRFCLTRCPHYMAVGKPLTAMEQLDNLEQWMSFAARLSGSVGLVAHGWKMSLTVHVYAARPHLGLAKPVTPTRRFLAAFARAAWCSISNWVQPDSYIREEKR
jgi:hypothetical protein